MRSIRVLTLVLLVLATGCAKKKPDTASRDKFDELTRTYIEAGFAFSPSYATYSGFHQFDDSLENWTPQAIQTEEARMRAALATLATIDPKTLDETRRLDYDLFKNGVDGQLFELTEMRRWEHDPGTYNYGFMLESMIARSYAPAEERLRSLTSRLRQVGRLLANARTNLKNPPRMFTEFAAGDFEGTISYLQNDVTKAFAEIHDPVLLTEFERAKTSAIQETQKHVQWMRQTLLSQSNGDYILGEDRYRKKLRYDDMIDLPLDTLLAVGGRELNRLETRYREAARRIDSKKSLDEIVGMMRRDHPSVETLLDEARGLLEEARTACDTLRFVHVPSEVRCSVRATPEFAASRSFASFDGPGPFETRATDAFYNITMPGKGWSRERVEQHLQGYNRWTLPSVSIHEVYPGHYVHFLYAKNAPTMVRKSMGSGSFAEGWGLYTEEGMLDAGYRRGDPKIEFGIMRWALVRACRLQVGIRLHTRGMTMEEGTRFFMEHAGMERANAEREAGRAAFDPTYSVYTLGALQIRKLRDDLKRVEGARFDIEKFHASILSQGALPVALLRRMLLGSGDTGSIL
jgi:uncharacterized protein (DUF885 family)